MDIQLNLINQSNQQDHQQVVIFQKNVATTFDERAVAWRVVNNLGMNENHPFVFPMAMDVQAGDSDGNFSPIVEGADGQMFDYALNGSGNGLSASGDSPSPLEVQIRNRLEKGAISASILKDGRKLATKTSVAPNQKAVFKFKPTLWIGVVSDVVEGKIIDSAVLSDVNTELSLLGLVSADIVMRGGGPGASSAPITFTLQNKVFA